jgi:hypothetical protein
VVSADRSALASFVASPAFSSSSSCAIRAFISASSLITASRAAGTETEAGAAAGAGDGSTEEEAESEVVAGVASESLEDAAVFESAADSAKEL